MQLEALPLIKNEFIEWVHDRDSERQKELECKINDKALTIIFQQAQTFFPFRNCPTPAVIPTRMFISNDSSEIKKTFLDYFPEDKWNKERRNIDEKYSFEMKFLSSKEDIIKNIQEDWVEIESMQEPKYNFFTAIWDSFFGLKANK